MSSETSKYRHLTVQFCIGQGVDIGSGGDPVVPHAIQVDLPAAEYAKYNAGHERPVIHLTCPADDLPFKDGTLDFVYSSHLLEDFKNWSPLILEWKRVVRTGGYLVILIPDKERWNAAIHSGQPPNCAHQHEGYPGELSRYFDREKWDILRDSLTNCSPGPHGIDYSILFVARKKL